MWRFLAVSRLSAYALTSTEADAGRRQRFGGITTAAIFAASFGLVVTCFM
jgi:hypothetical protein